MRNEKQDADWTEPSLRPTGLGQKVLLIICIFLKLHRWELPHVSCLKLTMTLIIRKSGFLKLYFPSSDCEEKPSNLTRLMASNDLWPGWATAAQSEVMSGDVKVWDAVCGHCEGLSEYLHTSHRRYFGGHSSNQLARLHMHTRWGSPWGAPGINTPCYNAMGPHMQTGCRGNSSC